MGQDEKYFSRMLSAVSAVRPRWRKSSAFQHVRRWFQAKTRDVPETPDGGLRCIACRSTKRQGTHARSSEGRVWLSGWRSG